MGDVVDLAAHRPHLSGTFACLDCHEEWVGVAPVGTVWVECPACTLWRGRMKYPVIPDTSWHCDCGNNLFYLMPDGRARCPCCGAVPSSWPA